MNSDPRRWDRESSRDYKVGRKFRVDVAELVDPWATSGFRWLEVFAWMVRESPGTPYGCGGVAELLSCKPTCVNMTYPDPLASKEWCDDLSLRFRYAVLYRFGNSLVQQWRESLHLRVGDTVVVPGPTVHPGRYGEPNPSAKEMTDRVHDLFWNADGRLAWCLNSCHRTATRIQGVEIRFRRDGVSVELAYGCHDGGRWYHTLATQQTREPLLCVIDRANDTLTRLKDRESEPPVIDTWAAHGGRPAKRAR